LRSGSKVDFLLDAIQDRSLRDHLRIDGPARFLLIGLVNQICVAPQQSCDSGARSEDVGDDLGALHPLEDKKRRAPLRGERPHDRGDLLVGRNLFTDLENILRVAADVVFQKRMEVLAHFTPA
jgi:hypothetical protein